ncbi:AzlC family ABC transporter permease [Desulfosporosinus sp. SYSU MS00001]|uniref:AzlC family ABC transporter permease n=1 Tax=Desulfosporosinus sp. SYSU MS00001 TaxID=3416284 RepID=UPI003CEB3386
MSIAIGYAPVAVTFGILATQFGISVWEAGLMSCFVFAGASQFIAIEMLHQGATAWMIGLTTLIVNIRHVLMSLSVVHFFPERSLTWSLGLAQGLTDETFVLNSRILKEVAGEEQRRRIMLGINSGAYASWVIFTILGGLIGKWLPFLLFKGKNVQGFVRNFIELVPIALLAALVIPELVTPGGSTIVLNNPYLWAGILTFLFARRVPNLFLGILFGMVVYWGCDKLLLIFH